ncbi:hypothetical protein ACIGG6_16485 [Vreelandella lionensis]|uniref:Uncharacterized protein n=1 Tax=Vreelandella lionensis TaxID=1144478 RepID=A0ABW8BZD3_9GAMM
MGEHFVVAYINDLTQTFTLTARKRDARLHEVTKQAKSFGNREIILATGLDKSTAVAMKKAIRTVYENIGYQYEPRPEL